MDSSTRRRDRIVVYSLIGIFSTSFLGLSMLVLAAGIYLARGSDDPKPFAAEDTVAAHTPAAPQREQRTASPPLPLPSTAAVASVPGAETPIAAAPATMNSNATDPDLPLENGPAVPERTSPVVDEVAAQRDEKSDTRSTRLEYQWPRNDSLVYQFSASVTIGSREVSLNGRNTLSPTGRQPDASAIEQSVTEGTGSGFLVTDNGVLITCAHVVDGATSIEVIQGQQSHRAKVIAIDEVLDLAVLQIKGESFPFLKIGDSDRVRLADEVRAVGFPLADLLGESIKVTRGEISGIGGPNGSSQLQIDASFNPGNSGGPVIDTSGHVVGVANALLSGLGISEIGFAIPAKEIASLARRHRLPVQFDSERDPLPPPDLIDQVSPAVVLLKVTQGLGGIGSKSASEIKFSNFWMESSREKDSRSFAPIPRFQPPRHANFSGAAYFDASGQALELDGRSALPYLLGNAAEIGIERLPDNAPGRTATQRVITIEVEPKDERFPHLDPYNGLPDRFRRPWMRSLPQQRTPRESYTGTESISVTVGEGHGDLVDVIKNYELKIPNKSIGKADMLQVIGKGTGHFNHKTGVMQDFEYHAEVVISQDNVTLTIPTVLKYSRVNEKQLAQERAKAEAMKLAAQQRKANMRGSIEFHPDQSADTPKTDRDAGARELSIKDLSVSSDLNQMLVNDASRVASGSAADVPIVKIEVPPTNDSGSIRQFRSGSWGYHGLAFTPNAGEVVTFGSDNLSVFDISSGKSNAYALDDSDARSRTCVAISLDGERILAGTQGGYVLVWKFTPGEAPEPEYRYRIDRREVKAIALSPDNKHVLTAHSGGDACLWELATGTVIARCHDFYFGSTAAVHFSSNGDQALICDTRNAVVLDVKDRKLVQKMPLTRGSGQCVAISPDGKRVSAGETYKMETWDAVTGQSLPACDGKQIQWSAAFSPSGSQLLTGGLNKITLWDVRTGQVLKEMTMSETGYVKYVAFSPDGVHCAAVGAPIGSLVEIFQLPTSLQGR